MEPLSHQRVRFVTGEDDAGKRLDQVLAAHIPSLSRRKARVAIDLGGIFVDGARVKVAGRVLRKGQTVLAHLGGALDRATKEVGREAREKDEARLPPYSIVYQDDDLIVIDKPAGLLTAPTPESDRGNLLELLKRTLKGPVFLIHRLDLETSGLVVFARNEEANRILSEKIRAHDFERVYMTALKGIVDWEKRTIEEPVGGKRAVSHFEVEERLPQGITRMRVRLETGRTHQIRLHARSVGHPVLGDRKYGTACPHDPPRLALHAARLGFLHPQTGESIAWQSDWPKDLSDWLEETRRAPKD